MTTAKTFDIHDYDFLYEEEVNNLEAETFQEASPSCARTHETASGKQKSETGVRQALTDTARKAQEKGNELWKSTENVRKNTARAAEERQTDLERFDQTDQGSFRFAGRPHPDGTGRQNKILFPRLWSHRSTLADADDTLVYPDHPYESDGSDLVREWNLLTEHVVGNGRRTRNRCSDYYPDRHGNSEHPECTFTAAADEAEKSGEITILFAFKDFRVSGIHLCIIGYGNGR